MTIKELAYAAQQQLLAHTGVSLKRSHLYELFSAHFGFHSYAALGVDAVFTRRKASDDVSAWPASSMGPRAVELGYALRDADTAASALLAFVKECHLDLVSISDLAETLREARQFADDYDACGVELEPVMIDGLESAAARGNALAHYVLALMHHPVDGNEGSAHWHALALQGRALSGAPKEWADAHATHLDKAKKYEHHLRASARLGLQHALLDLAQAFDDPAFFDQPSHGGYVDLDPVVVAEIARRFGRTEDARHWLARAAESGDIEAMRTLIDEHDHDDLLRCWTWVYLARLLDVDLTKDDFHAIHDDGSPYDDDVGGAVYADGYAGIELAPLGPQLDLEARQEASRMFSGIATDDEGS